MPSGDTEPELVPHCERFERPWQRASFVGIEVPRARDHGDTSAGTANRRSELRDRKVRTEHDGARAAMGREQPTEQEPDVV